MKDSQYLESYLSHNGCKDGTGYTVGTYLAYNLRGNAKRYSGKYEMALTSSLLRAVARGEAYIGDSIRGGMAFYRTAHEAILCDKHDDCKEHYALARECFRSSHRKDV